MKVKKFIDLIYESHPTRLFHCYYIRISNIQKWMSSIEQLSAKLCIPDESKDDESEINSSSIIGDIGSDEYDATLKQFQDKNNLTDLNRKNVEDLRLSLHNIAVSNPEIILVKENKILEDILEKWKSIENQIETTSKKGD